MVGAGEHGRGQAELGDPVPHPAGVARLVRVLAAEEEEARVRAPLEDARGRLHELDLALRRVDPAHEDHDRAARAHQGLHRVAAHRPFALDRRYPVVHHPHALAKTAVEALGHGLAHPDHPGAAPGHERRERPVPREVVLHPHDRGGRPGECRDESGLHAVRVDHGRRVAGEQAAQAEGGPEHRQPRARLHDVHLEPARPQPRHEGAVLERHDAVHPPRVEVVEEELEVALGAAAQRVRDHERDGDRARYRRARHASTDPSRRPRTPAHSPFTTRWTSSKPTSSPNWSRASGVRRKFFRNRYARFTTTSRLNSRSRLRSASTFRWTTDAVGTNRIRPTRESRYEKSSSSSRP